MNTQKVSGIVITIVLLAIVAWSIRMSPKQVVVPTISLRYQDFEQTAAALEATEPNTSTEAPPVAAFVGHHLLAAELFRDTIAKIPSGSIRHVILISPNHFLYGRGRLQTVERAFETPYGVVRTNTELTNILTADGLVTNEPATFIGEHGITNIVPYVKKLLPHADITPIAIWSGIRQERLDALRALLRDHLQPGTLVIGSFDCSHYVTSAKAITQDTVTLKALETLDLAALRTADVDSPEGLWLLGALAKDLGAKRFTVDAATNSGILTQAPPRVEVTSYITGRFFR
jgi:AmmeMemoRadiSam system protein B